MMIILLILITLSLDSVWILLGENCCWSLLGLKRLRGWESLLAAYTNNSVHFLWYFLGNCSAHQHSLRSSPGGSQAGFRKPHFQDAFGGLFKVKVRNFSGFYNLFFFCILPLEIARTYANNIQMVRQVNQTLRDKLSESLRFRRQLVVGNYRNVPSIVTDLNNSKSRGQELTVFVR